MEDFPDELEEKLYKKIIKLCNTANKWEDQEKYDKAIHYFEKAFELLPHPKTIWGAGSWILTAIGDCYFSKRSYKHALVYLRHSEIYPKGIESGFQQLRIGQSYFELNNTKDAQEYLMRAYLLGTKELFKKEDEKYWNLLLPLL